MPDASQGKYGEEQERLWESVKRNSSGSSRPCGLMGQPEVKGAGRSMPEELLIYCFGGARQLAALPLNAIKNKGATAINNKENANGMDSRRDGDLKVGAARSKRCAGLPNVLCKFMT